MPPQTSQITYASSIGSSIYDTATATATSVASATPTSTASDDDDGSGQSWSNYLYVVVIFVVVFLLLGFFYQRRRRNLATSQLPRNRFQAFHTHHPSQSRDLSAVHANNRVWRNMRAGPFSHHARFDSAGARRPGTASTADRSRLDLDEEVPPPYVPAEPERTLDRGSSTRDSRNAWPSRRTGDEVDLSDLTTRDERGSINKPPGYEERSNLGRHD